MIQIDQLLHEDGARWRAEVASRSANGPELQVLQPAIAMTPAATGTRRWLLPLVTAAAVTLVSGAAAVIATSGGSNSHQPGGAGGSQVSSPASATSRTAQTDTPTADERQTAQQHTARGEASSHLTDEERRVAVQVALAESIGAPPDGKPTPSSTPSVSESASVPASAWPSNVDRVVAIADVEGDATTHTGAGADGESTPVVVVQMFGDFSEAVSEPGPARPGESSYSSSGTPGPAQGTVMTVVVETATSTVRDWDLEPSEKTASLLPNPEVIFHR